MINKTKKRNFKKLKRKDGTKKRFFIRAVIIIMVLFSLVYLYGRLILKWDAGTDNYVATSFTVIGAIIVLIEFESNNTLNESQFVMELNNEFISNKGLTDVELDLERYYAKYKEGTLTDQYRKSFQKKYSLFNPGGYRQDLVNYLVHLEGIATIVNSGVLHLDVIDDLMAYRYFIAVNNPDVQEMELYRAPYYYRGCFELYSAWVEEQKKHLINKELIEELIPMKKNNLSSFEEAMEKSGRCNLKVESKQ